MGSAFHSQSINLLLTLGNKLISLEALALSTLKAAADNSDYFATLARLQFQIPDAAIVLRNIEIKGEIRCFGRSVTMIRRLEYAVRFAATGRELSASLDFPKGMTAITGPNEAGKSMVVEMIRYAFFGSEALRGVADDYARLQVQLEWKNYRIERSNKGAKIWRSDEMIATGTKPVNAKVIEILGFGLDVFDVSCVCNQGDVERLGSMKPAERKRMVDRVIGVDRIDELQKWTGEQALLLNREIEVLSRGLVKPEEPERPDGYCPSATLQGYVGELRAVVAEADHLRGWLSHKRTAPVAPNRPEGDLAELEVLLAVIDAEQAQRVHLMSIPVVDFNAEKVRAEWEAYDLWTQRQAFEKQHPRPTLSREWVENGLKILERQAERAQLEKSLPKGTSVDCPNCGNAFCLEHETIDRIEADIEEIDRALKVLGKPTADTADRATLVNQKQMIDDWDSPDTIATWERLKDATRTDRPLVTRAELIKAAFGVTPTERERRLAAIPNSGSRVVVAPKIAALRAWGAQEKTYQRDMSAYEVWVAERAVKAATLAELEPAAAGLLDMECRLREAQAFETARDAYTKAVAAHQKMADDIAEKKTDLEGWRSAKDALADLRMRIKTYLVPSLNKVASHLLTQMTGGQRSSIVVDENFDVVVDGQRLETLSGSGKACANLALRIGLGQVLTNNIMSLFIGDEIDASMDDDRAENTHLSIGQLSGTLSQILLVTHKLPTVDQTIILN